MKIIEQKKGDVSIVSIQGEINADNVAQLKKVMSDLAMADKVKVVLDLGQMNYIDSSGLAELIAASHEFRKKKGDLHLATMNEIVQEIFDVTFLNRHFKIFPAVDNACKEF